MKPNLRVCFVSSYPPNHARLSEYAQSLVKEIADRPVVSKVFVLADMVNGSKDNVVESSKVEVLRIWRADRSLSILSIMWYILVLKPDVVHFNLHFQSFGKSRLSNFFGFSLVFFSRMFGLKVLVLLHNLAEKVDLEKVRLKRSLVNRVGMIVATRFVLSASSLVVTVPSYVEYLKERYNHGGVRYIPHGALVSSRLSVKHDGKVVLVFGHMGPSKGLPVIFQVFEEMVKERGDVRLVVAGDSHPNFPHYLGDLRKVAPRGVDFLGYVEEADVERVFGMADVVVLPYFTATGTSGVFHLACGYGKPIVASALPEIKELVDEGASAFLKHVGDVGGFKSAILQVLFNDDIADKMSWQNLMFAKRGRWSVVAEEYEKAYLELLYGCKVGSPAVLR